MLGPKQLLLILCFRTKLFLNSLVLLYITLRKQDVRLSTVHQQCFPTCWCLDLLMRLCINGVSQRDDSHRPNSWVVRYYQDSVQTRCDWGFHAVHQNKSSVFEHNSL